MEVERGDDRHVRAHRRADSCHQVTVGIVTVGGDHRTVVGDIDTVELAGRGNPGRDAIDEIAHQVAVDRPMRVARGKKQWHWLPFACGVHHADEGGRLGCDYGVFGPRGLDDRVAFQDVKALEVFARSHR